jgi:hypothetical protein
MHSLKKWLPFLPLAFFATFSAHAYYGGGTLNHGHTSAAGDGGPLSNPVVSGTATLTGLSVSTAVIGNLFVTNGFVRVSSLTFSDGSSSYITGRRANLDGTPRYQLKFSPNASGSATLWETGRLSLSATAANQPALDLGGQDIGKSNASGTNAAANVFTSTVITNNITTLDYASGNTSVTISSDSWGYVLSTVAANVAVDAATSGQYKNVVSMTLPIGVWDVDGQIQHIPNGATETYTGIAISSFTGNTTTDHVVGVNDIAGVHTTAGTNTVGNNIAPYRMTVTSAITVYLKFIAGYTVATPRYTGGYMRATRIR